MSYVDIYVFLVSKKVPILLTTDVLARGIDFKNVKHVINFDFAENVSVFIHRAGRTARQGNDGKGIDVLCDIYVVDIYVLCDIYVVLVTSLWRAKNERMVKMIKEIGGGDLGEMLSERRQLSRTFKKQKENER